jgi:hypothetical protein
VFSRELGHCAIFLLLSLQFLCLAFCCCCCFCSCLMDHCG